MPGRQNPFFTLTLVKGCNLQPPEMLVINDSVLREPELLVAQVLVSGPNDSFNERAAQEQNAFGSLLPTSLLHHKQINLDLVFSAAISKVQAVV